MSTTTKMQSLAALDRFRAYNESFPESRQIEEHKEKGGRVFGWLCTYVPEEILHAAGILPVRITGEHRETDLDDANAYLYVNTCSFSRSCFQLGIRGEYDFLDGVVGGSTCDGARRLFDLWRNYIGTPFHHVLTVPRKYTERAHELYFQEVKQFKEHLEEELGLHVTDDALGASIRLYNRSRELLGKLYELRKRDKPPISGAETMEVLNASYRMPKETFNAWLSDLIEEKSRVLHVLVVDVPHRDANDLGSKGFDDLCDRRRSVTPEHEIQQLHLMAGIARCNSHAIQSQRQGQDIDLLGIGGYEEHSHGNSYSTGNFCSMGSPISR